MEMFRRASVVRLLSHHDRYLMADEDEELVSQGRDGNDRRAMWQVEFVPGSNLIRLKSCFGKYLTASDESQFLGLTGKKVLQTFQRRPDSSAEWEPIREGVEVKLRSRYGYFLRANGGLRPWRNTVTHNIPRRSVMKDWVLWEVDVMELREEPVLPESLVTQSWSNSISRSTTVSSGSERYMSAHSSPQLTPTTIPQRTSLDDESNISRRISLDHSPDISRTTSLEHSPNSSLCASPKLSPKITPKLPFRMSPRRYPLLSSKMSTRMFQPCHQISEGLMGSPVPAKSEGRLIWFKVTGENFAEMDETLPGGNSFHFKGSEVEELKVKLAEETGLDDEEFIVCSRNPFSGRLYPLKLDLPPNHAPMNLFVVPSSSEVAQEIMSWDSPRAVLPDLPCSKIRQRLK